MGNVFRLTAGSAVALATVMCSPCFAQAAGADTGLEEIIVTAQKREQSMMDVPIAVTALSGEALQANRVVDVTDLSGLAPGVIVHTAAGGSKLPQFSIRGAFSTGLVPGSDKQVSIYLDGVYISSPRGSIFELADTQRIEVLRGPQGTLFGRNATAGAVSITTRDPSGEFGVKLMGTVGNYDQWRAQVSVDLPQMGPFSGYLSYVHSYKRGDIRNAGAGQVWDRRGASDPRIAKLMTSPDYLGTKDVDTFFAALKFESGDFKTVYKFDRTEDNGTPEGTALIGLNTSAALVGPLFNALVNSQPGPVYFARDGKRPDVVNNAWATPTIQRIEGHSLTSTLGLGDRLSIKNIFAYRKSFLYSSSALDGVSSLVFTPQAVTPYATFVAASTIPNFGQLPPAQQGAAIGQIAAGLQPLVGQPFVGIAQQNLVDSKQVSDELQLNYNSDFLTATAGAIWFHSIDRTGDKLLQGTTSFAPLANGVIPQRGVGYTYNKATSLAAYAQLEFHVTPQLDLVAGARITGDRKSGTFSFGNPPALTTLSFTYRKTKPNFLVGINYKPTQDVLLYGKFSTAFVSGGSVASIPFEPETAESWEGGVKAELLDRKLRASLALYAVTYKHFQVAGSGTNFRTQITQITGNAALAGAIGSFVVDQGGPVKAHGAEFELAGAPARGLTLGGSLSYNHTKFENVSPILVSGFLGAYEPYLRPKWTAGLWGQFDTPPLLGDAFLSFRADGNWQSANYDTPNPHLAAYAPGGFAYNMDHIPAFWLVNARVALKDITVGTTKAELAVWSKNLTNAREKGYAVNLSQIFAQANFIPARTYGLDLTIQF